MVDDRPLRWHHDGTPLGFRKFLWHFPVLNTAHVRVGGENTHSCMEMPKKNVSFVVLDLNGTPRYMRELIPCWECSIDCYRRANSTHVSWLEFHHDVGVEIPEQVSPTIGFSPIKTHLWTCRFSAFFSWQFSLHCSPMKRFSKQTAWRLRGPAMKDGTTKIIQRLWGDAPSEPWWNSGIWNHKDKKSPFLFFGTEHVRLKTHM